MEIDSDELVPPSAPSSLSSLQLRAVDQAFEQLFGYKWGTQFEMKEPQTQEEEIICRILGKSAAASILHNKSTLVVPTTKRKPTVTKRDTATKVTRKRSPSISSNIQSQSTSSTSSIARPEGVGTKQTSAAPKRGVDQLLQTIQGAEGTTTIAKTNADWETFKDQTGLGSKLEEKAEGKDAFLNRQEFLTRVDHRTFALERKERDKERSKRGI
jgi:hypothetical protein